jgi:hypothetical protein
VLANRDPRAAPRNGGPIRRAVGSFCIPDHSTISQDLPGPDDVAGSILAHVTLDAAKTNLEWFDRFVMGRTPPAPSPHHRRTR